jgi:hypothetical protein
MLNSEKFPKTMTRFLPPGKIGVAEVTHFTLSEDEARFGNLRAMIHGDQDALVSPGRYVMLKINGKLVMTDTAMERRTNRRFVNKAQGRVLVAGLGIGLILHPLAAKPEVTEVLVIEKEPDVVALVGPTLPANVQAKILLGIGDIFTWRPTRGTLFDTIYFDIWPDISADNLVEIRQLKQAFRRYLSPGGWMGAWKDDQR